MENIKNLAMQLTAYERVGSVGEEEYRQMMADKLEFEAEHVCFYNDFMLENSEEPFMTFAELEEDISQMCPIDAFRLARMSDISYNDDYFRYNGYGNLESFSEYAILKEMMDDKEFRLWYWDTVMAHEHDDHEMTEIIDEANRLIKAGF